MTNTFRAIRLFKTDAGQETRFVDLTETDLMDGDVTVRVEYSTATVTSPSIRSASVRSTNRVSWPASVLKRRMARKVSVMGSGFNHEPHEPHEQKRRHPGSSRSELSGTLQRRWWVPDKPLRGFPG